MCATPGKRSVARKKMVGRISGRTGFIGPVGRTSGQVVRPARQQNKTKTKGFCTVPE
jgi:hypothetical protein